MSNYNQDNETLVEEASEVKVRTHSSNKRQLASMVDNEIKEVNELMSKLDNFNHKREELQMRLKRMPNTTISP